MIGYLGPAGTFTHQAAETWAAAHAPGAVLVPLGSVGEAHDAVAHGDVECALVPVENSIEGFVTPTLDALLASGEVVAVGAVTLDIAFDAFVRPGHDALTTASAHSHGLAQCSRFISERGLRPAPAASNAAACRDLDAHSVAFGPRLCGPLYGLETLAEGVEDFAAARTRFLVLARRERASQRLTENAAATANPARPGSPPEGPVAPDPRWHTLLAITPVEVGPGVLARVTETFRRHRVNMSSLITRPLKARAEQYVFVITLGGAPHHEQTRVLMRELLAAGDCLKVLGAYLGDPEDDALGSVLSDHLPKGSVGADAPLSAQNWSLLW